MDKHHSRSSASPLIDPAVCAVVLLAPGREDLRSLSPRVRGCFQRNIQAVAEASDIAAVPLMVTSPFPNPGKHALAKTLPITPSRREYPSGEQRLPWSDPAFQEALAELDRSALIIAGFWLEHQVLATALHALAEAYDAYVLIDATPARAAVAGQVARERLVQAGATPVVTTQIIHEWSLEASDSSKRAALLSSLALLTRQ